jgi:NCS1 nucleoside transporter family
VKLLNSTNNKTKSFERFGLEAVPNHLKTSSWYDYFFIQVAISVNAGNFLVPALAVLVGGLSFPAAVFSTFIGGLLAFLLVSLLSKPGASYGIPSQFAVRSFLGTNVTRYFASPVRTITSLYWFAVQTIGGTFVLLELGERVFSVKLPFVLTSALMAVVMSTLALVGFHAVKKITTSFLPLLILGGIIMIYLLMTSETTTFTEILQKGHAKPFTMIFFASLAFVQYVSGVSSASDLTRYAKSEKQAFWGLYSGNSAGFLMTSVLGAYAATLAGDWNPFVIASRLTNSPWLLTIIFLTALLSMININLSNAYTAGYSFLNTFPKLGRIKSAIIVGVIGVLLSTMPNLVEQAKVYISSLGAVVIPLSATIVTDYLVSKHTNYLRMTVPTNRVAIFTIIFGSISYLSIPEDYSPGFISFILTSALYFILKKRSS